MSGVIGPNDIMYELKSLSNMTPFTHVTTKIEGLIFKDEKVIEQINISRFIKENNKAENNS